MKKADKSLIILKTAEELFLQNGYTNTSLRELSNKCQIALGLITYHFGSKAGLAKAILEKHFKHIEEAVDSVVSVSEEPLLYRATYLRYSNWYFLQPERRDLYIEFQKEGIYTSYLYETGLRTLNKLVSTYGTSLSDDHLLLYGNYLPTDIERTLILQKQEGVFKNIDEKDIPTIVFKNSSLPFNIDRAIIDETVNKSIELCKKITDIN